MKNGTEELLLLQSIQCNSGLHHLIDMGLEYSSIAILLRNLVERDLVKEIDGEYTLTPLGRKKLVGKRKKLPRGSDIWLEKKDEYYINKISIGDIYIPKKF